MEHMKSDYNKKTGNWFNTSWFCWKLLQSDLIFERLEYENKYYNPKQIKPNKVLKFKLHERNYARNKRGKR